VLRPSACGQRARLGGHGPARPQPADASGPAGRRQRGQDLPAARRAQGVRRPARPAVRHAPGPHAPRPGPHQPRSGIQRRPRLRHAARARRINLRLLAPTRVGVAVDEGTTLGDLADLVTAFSLNEVLPFMVEDLGAKADPSIPAALHRTSSYLTHPVFHRYRSETEMLRYIKRLEARDLSLTSAMIPL